jgi:hypothetical protein
MQFRYYVVAASVAGHAWRGSMTPHRDRLGRIPEQSLPGAKNSGANATICLFSNS